MPWRTAVHTRTERDRFFSIALAAGGLLCAITFLSASRDARGEDLTAASGSAQPTVVQKPSASPTDASVPGAGNSNSATTGAPAPAAANTPAISKRKIESISANPAAVNIVTGTGLLGRTLGLDKIPGVFLGGLWIGNGNYLVTGGFKPGKWSFNSLFLMGLDLDLEKLAGLPGSQFGVEVLQLNGQGTNEQAGALMGYNGLESPKPLDRTQLYELWWRQSLFNDKLIIRVGKSVTTNDFNNVSAPVPVEDNSLAIPAVTSLLFTPIFKNPTLIGASPGYYNSAYGVVLTYAPTHNFYISYGSYDGAIASGIQTGLREWPVFNGHYFNIVEAGYAWLLGENHSPGILAMGGWAQTGELYGPGIKENGAGGFYTFGSQRLWREHPGIDNAGISAFFQFGINDSRTMIAQEYFGSGVTGFGLIPGRPDDSLGMGVAWSWLNRDLGLRSNEFMTQVYYQMHLIGATFLEPAISYIPNPGDKPGLQGAVALTTQMTILF